MPIVCCSSFTFLANIPSLTYGVQIGWLSPMGPLLQSAASPAPAPLTDSAISWMAAALPLAAVPSVPAFSYASDRLGRKWTIMLLSAFFAVSWTLKLWLVTPAGLVMARACAGAAAAGCFVAVPAYVRETAEDSLRGALGSLTMTLCNVGVILVYVLGMYLTYFWNQWVYLAVCFVHIALSLFIPESPAFLVKKGKYEAAKKAIAWLRGLPKEDTIVTAEVDALKQENELYKSVSDIPFKNIVKDRPISHALRICLVLIGVQTLSGCFAVVNYAASVFERAGAAWSANGLALLVGALQLAGSLVATATVDRCGRKILLTLSCAVVSACMGMLATTFLLSHLRVEAPGWLPVAAVCACIFAYGAGLAPVPFVVMAEVFSFQLRARLSGVVMMFSWTNSSLTVLLFAPLASIFGEHAVFAAFALVTLLGAVYTAACVPETRGRSLEEIQKCLR